MELLRSGRLEIETAPYSSIEPVFPPTWLPSSGDRYRVLPSGNNSDVEIVCLGHEWQRHTQILSYCSE